MKTWKIMAVAVLAAGVAQAALVHYYELESATANQALDSVGSNIGTVTDATVTSGLFGNAYYFGGDGDRVNLNAVIGVRPTGTFTTAFWMKTANTDQNNKQILGNNYTAANAPSVATTGLGWIIKTQNTPSNTRVFIDDGADKVLPNGPLLTSNNWQLVVLRFQSVGAGTSVARFSNLSLLSGATNITAATVDGNTGVLATMNATLTYDTPVKSTYLGALSDGASGFEGIIDDLRFYNHSLSDAEIADLYNAGVAAIPEPATLGMIGAGAFLVLAVRRMMI